jgi:hypothetical protein
LVGGEVGGEDAEQPAGGVGVADDGVGFGDVICTTSTFGDRNNAR